MKHNKATQQLAIGIIISIITLLVITGIFTMAIKNKGDNRAIQQQLIEKELALLIAAAKPTTTYYIEKQSIEGIINKITLEEGMIKATVNNLASLKGYSYHTRNKVRVTEKEKGWEITIT